MKNLITILVIFLSLSASYQFTYAQWVQWVQRYNGPGNGSDAANSIIIDGSGNVYVTGSSGGIGTSLDYTTLKYNSNGATLWAQRYNGPGNHDDVSTSIAVDGLGNVYVTGSSKGSGTSEDYATIKYNSNGDMLWVKRYNAPSNGGDYARSIAVDGSGNVYVTGLSTGSGIRTDYATIKYNSNGDSLWVQRYNGPGNTWNIAWSIAVDGSGNVYVTGSSNGNGTSEDYATIKYNSNGDSLWVQRYKRQLFSVDEARSIAVDGLGNVYVTGQSTSDYLTIKYNSSGVQQWVQRYNGPEYFGHSSYDDAYSVKVDNSGNVYVTGKSEGVNRRCTGQ